MVVDSSRKTEIGLSSEVSMPRVPRPNFLRRGLDCDLVAHVDGAVAQLLVRRPAVLDGPKSGFQGPEKEKKPSAGVGGPRGKPYWLLAMISLSGGHSGGGSFRSQAHMSRERPR